MDNYAERVQEGMAFLDQHRPGWEDSINIFSLNIARSDQCALGQVYGSYNRGLTVTGCVGTDRYGFSATASAYPALTMAWKQAIVQRQVEKARQDFVAVA